VAYGGPDLSDRNLAGLERFLALKSGGREPGRARERLPVSASGDIHSGRIAAEYLMRGASSFQMHTLFQLPDSEFTMRAGNKTDKVLHQILFHPQDGFLVWLLDLGQRFGLKGAQNVAETAAWCRDHWDKIIESLGYRAIG